MSSEDLIKRRLRRSMMLGDMTAGAVDWQLNSKNFTPKEKMEIISMARRAIKKSGLDKIYADSIKLAIREWRKGKPQLSLEELKKKVDEELKGYDYG